MKNGYLLTVESSTGMQGKAWIFSKLEDMTPLLMAEIGRQELDALAAQEKPKVVSGKNYTTGSVNVGAEEKNRMYEQLIKLLMPDEVYKLPNKVVK